MALDAATLALVANELNSTLLDAKIDKIFEPTRDEVLMTLRTRTQTFKLLLSARSGSARVCLTKESFENPLTPPGFCMLLRKHLTGGRLTGLHMEPGVAYANNGQIKRVATSTFIITPYNVDIMGDLLDELENNGVFF